MCHTEQGSLSSNGNGVVSHMDRSKESAFRSIVHATSIGHSVTGGVDQRLEYEPEEFPLEEEERMRCMGK